MQGVASGDQGSTVISTGVGGAGIAGSFGTLTVNANGSFNYVVNNANTTVQGLNVGGTLTDTFTYTMRDTALTTDNALVTFTINGANDAPVAVNDGSAATPAYIAFEGSPLVVTLANGIRNNDTDVDNLTSSLTATKDTNPLHGTVTVNGDGSFTYTPTAGYLGGDSFTYHVNDPDPPGASVSLASNSATVFIDVQPRVWHIDNAFVGPGTGPLGSATNPFLSIDAFNTANAAARRRRQAGHHLPARRHRHLHHHGRRQSVQRPDVPRPGRRPDLHDQRERAGRPAAHHAGQSRQHPDSGHPGDRRRRQCRRHAGAEQHARRLHHRDHERRRHRHRGFEPRWGTTSAGTVGTLNVSLVGISGVGKAVDIDQGGTLNVSLSSIASTGSNSEGIQLGGVAGSTLGGSFAVTGTTSITNAETTGIQIGTTAANASFNFGTSTTVNDTAAGGHTANGIDLSTSIGATNSFAFGNLAVTTDGGFGLKATSAGTVDFGATNSIVAAGGAAVDITSTALTDATFGTVSSSGSSTYGINLVNQTSGTFTANGGTIGTANIAGVHIAGGTAAATINSAINSSNGNAVDISGHNTGTINLGGTINHTSGGDKGIIVASNTGGTINFTGQTTIASTDARSAST